MNQRIDAHVSEILFKFELPDPVQDRRAAPASGGAPAAADQRPGLPRPPAAKKPGGKAGKAGRAGKVGRNEPCPCGSGKKYKKCCGAT
jgi:hypothetical protein